MTRDDNVGLQSRCHKKIMFFQRFPLPYCQFLTNLNFEKGSVILNLLVKDHEKLFF